MQNQNQSGCGLLLVRWMVSAVSIYIASKIVTGFELESFEAAIWVAAVLGLVNTFLKPILLLLSMPLIMLTFGLFLLIINAVSLHVAADFVSGLTIVGFWPGVWAALIISLVSYLTNLPTGNNNQSA